MALEGLHAVQARIAAIQSKLGVVQAPATAAPAAEAGRFEEMYSAALAGGGSAAAPSGVLTPARLAAPGGYGKLAPPPELAAYGNGKIPAEALVPIGHGDHRLHGPAAAAFRRMEADAAAAGVRLGVTDSYRTLESQVDLARRKGLHSHGGLAATPGTSNHGWGLSLDLDLDAHGQQWMREHGWRYGFVEDVPREPWHWTYRPAT